MRKGQLLIFPVSRIPGIVTLVSGVLAYGKIAA